MGIMSSKLEKFRDHVIERMNVIRRGFDGNRMRRAIVPQIMGLGNEIKNESIETLLDLALTSVQPDELEINLNPEAL